MTDSKAILYILGEDKVTRTAVINASGNKGKRTTTSIRRVLTPCLALRFEDKHAIPGIVGGHSEDADIVLPNWKGVGNFHFVITFDEQNRLILRETSHYGTRLSYSNSTGEKKSNFTWLLHSPGAISGDRVHLQVSHRLKFHLVLVDHNVHSQPHISRVAGFLTNTNNISCEPSKFDVKTEAVSETWSPPNDAHIHVIKYVNQGAFGAITSVWNASTGYVYALKVPVRSTFLDGGPASWQSWDDEAKTMSTVSHDHIVTFHGIADYEDPGYGGVYPSEDVHPGLRFEYVAGGSLFDHRRSLSALECVEVLCQLLSALAYLHSFNPPICHRDIKPGNILVQHRTPGRDIFVKFADFGLAKTSDYLATTVGTALYMAPEIYQKYMKQPLTDAPIESTMNRYRGAPIVYHATWPVDRLDSRAFDGYNAADIHGYPSSMDEHERPLTDQVNRLHISGGGFDDLGAYTEPLESYDPRLPYTVRVDVYSLGLVIAEQLCGLPPKSHMHASAWISVVRKHITKYADDKSNLPKNRQLVRFLLESMLVENPHHRRSAAECLVLANGFREAATFAQYNSY